MLPVYFSAIKKKCFLMMFERCQVGKEICGEVGIGKGTKQCGFFGSFMGSASNNAYALSSLEM